MKFFSFTPPSPHPTLWKQVTKQSPHSGGGKLSSSFLMGVGGVYITYLEPFCMESRDLNPGLSDHTIYALIFSLLHPAMSFFLDSISHNLQSYIYQYFMHLSFFFTLPLFSSMSLQGISCLEESGEQPRIS